MKRRSPTARRKAKERLQFFFKQDNPSTALEPVVPVHGLRPAKLDKPEPLDDSEREGLSIVRHVRTTRSDRQLIAALAGVSIATAKTIRKRQAQNPGRVKANKRLSQQEKSVQKHDRIAAERAAILETLRKA